MQAPGKLPVDRKRELIGLVLIFLSLFIFLSLITHSPRDYDCVVYPANETVQNKAGRVGAFLSYHLLLLFGLGAAIIMGLTCFWGVLLFLKPQINYLIVKLTCLVLFIVAILAFLGLVTPDKFSNWRLSASMESFGGMVGFQLARYLSEYLGSYGTFLVVLATLIVSSFLATDWATYYLAKKSWQTMRQFIGPSILTFWRKIKVIKPTKIKPQWTPLLTTSSREVNQSDGESNNTPYLSAVHEIVPLSTSTSQRKAQTSRISDQEEYTLPPIDLLEDPQPILPESTQENIKERAAIIEHTLSSFGISAQLVNVECGPVVTEFEIELAPGVSVHRVAGLADDLAIALKAPNVRIVAPIPGKSTVGIEVPNAFKGIVRLKELIHAIEQTQPQLLKKLSLPLFLGRDAAGTPLIKDLENMPHLLIAGTTGSGKSVCVASVILSLLMTRNPDDLKLILIDPKMVELSAFKEIPHLLSPVITDMRQAPALLKWLVRTMEERYELFLRAGVRNIAQYNQLTIRQIKEKLSEDGDEPEEVPTHLPYIVVIIDELADLMMAASDDVETAITRLTQKSRAVGIHLVVATQRPSVDVITGLIKSNMPARIAFKVASKIDSRTILDRNGAEKLLGAGDMLLLLPGSTELCRAQGTLVTEKEINNVVEYLRQQGKPVYEQELLNINPEAEVDKLETDPLLDQAIQIVLETQRGSVTLLQRRLSIGFTRAARLIDIMAKLGIVGPYKNSKAREVLMTLEEWAQKKSRLMP